MLIAKSYKLITLFSIICFKPNLKIGLNIEVDLHKKAGAIAYLSPTFLLYAQITMQ